MFSRILLDCRRALLVIAGALAMAAGCGGEAPPPLPPGPDAAPGLPACSMGNSMADVEGKLFHNTRCALCHGKQTLFPTTLDLTSDGLPERMVGKMAESNPDKGRCGGRPLIPRDDPTGGVFVEKVASDKPSCGVRMPQGMLALTADEISCVKMWAILAARAVP